MYKVLVLAGGSSNEREVSLRSGEAVRTALRTAGHTVTFYDPAGGLEALDEHIKTVDVVFPALHGKGGEDGIIQKYLEEHSKAFIGSGSEASGLCFNKWRYKQYLLDQGFLSPKGALVNQHTIWQHGLTKKPFVLKPYAGGSSIDTFIMRDSSNMNKEAIERTLAKYDAMLLEELITGTETTVAVLGQRALPMIEIVPPSDQEFDYENKYNGKTQELCPPRHVAQGLQQQAQALALDIHNSTSCKSMSRTDIMITPHGQLYVLETNTIPGLTNQSLMPKAAEVAGIDMPALVNILVEDALNQAV